MSRISQFIHIRQNQNHKQFKGMRNCFKLNHTASACKSVNICRECQQKHNHLFHLSEFTSANFQNEIVHSLKQQNIQWHFILARSPHRGGFGETGIKAIKFHLKRVVGNALLTYEEMLTDGLIRTATIKTSTEIVTRATNRICPFPTEDFEQDSSKGGSNVQDRPVPLVKVPDQGGPHPTTLP
jgi:hypothetical protein